MTIAFSKMVPILLSIAVLAGFSSEAKSAELRTKLGLSVATADNCGKVNVSRIKRFNDARSASSSCAILHDEGEDWGLTILLSEATAPIDAVPTFRALTIGEIQALTANQLQDLFLKWLKSDLREPQRTAGWSNARTEIKSVSKGTLSRGPFACANYTSASKHKTENLKAETVGMRCARLSKNGQAIEEVAIQATTFMVKAASTPRIFREISQNSIKSMRYKK